MFYLPSPNSPFIMFNLETKRINQLIYSEYNPEVEYPDDVLLEFDFYDAVEIIFKYGIGTSHPISEVTIYQEGEILITKSSPLSNRNDIYIYKYITGQQIDLLKSFWLNNDIKHQNCNLLIDLDINKQAGIMVFYNLDLVSGDGLKDWGYLNHLAGNLNNLYNMIENNNISIISEQEVNQ